MSLESSRMHLYVPTADSLASSVRTNCILLYFTLIYILPSTAYRRKTTTELGYTKPTRTLGRKPKTRKTTEMPKKKKPRKKSSDEYGDYKDGDGDDDDGDGDGDDDADVDADADADTDDVDDKDDGDGEDADMDDDRGWFNEMKMDPQFADDEDSYTTATPIDLLTEYKPRWTTFEVDLETPSTTEGTTTTLMALSVIGFNETWCAYIKKSETQKLESEAFIEAVKKLCSEEHAEDNDVRLALRHTFEGRKQIDRLMNDLIRRLAAQDEDKKEKLLNPKHKVNSQNEFCYSRALKSFKYFCFDADANPYMQRYLKIFSNACRLPEVDVSDIREHLVETCENIDNNLADVL